MVIRSDLCAFSGAKIYPGHGKHYVPTTSVQQTRPVFHFVSSKTFANFELRRKPREVRWTQFYRKINKKGVKLGEKVVKQRTTVDKSKRAYQGASLDLIQARLKASEAQAKQAAESARVKAIKKREAKVAKKKEEKKEKRENRPQAGGAANVPKVQKRRENRPQQKQ